MLDEDGKKKREIHYYAKPLGRDVLREIADKLFPRYLDSVSL